MSREVFGEDHVFVVHSLTGLATEFHRRGRFEESHVLLREARGLVRERDRLLAVAFLLHDEGRLEEAEVALVVVALPRQTGTSFGESSSTYQESVGVLAKIFEQAGRGEEASRVRAGLP